MVIRLEQVTLHIGIRKGMGGWGGLRIWNSFSQVVQDMLRLILLLHKTVLFAMSLLWTHSVLAIL